MGDELVIDGGMACFEVTEKTGNDLHCKCIDAGLFLPGAKFSFWRDGKLSQASLSHNNRNIISYNFGLGLTQS